MRDLVRPSPAVLGALLGLVLILLLTVLPHLHAFGLPTPADLVHAATRWHVK